MTGGDVPTPQRGNWLSRLEERRTAVVIVSTAVVTTSLLLAGLTDWPTWLKTGFQILAAVAGAVLGAFFQKDKTRAQLETYLPGSVRHLLDHLLLLNRMIDAAQEARLQAEQARDQKTEVSAERTAETLRMLERDARGAVRSAQTAVEAWADIDRPTVDHEVEQYLARQNRLSQQLRSDDD